LKHELFLMMTEKLRVLP